MSVRVLLTLIIGILLAGAGLALLIWLLWKLWKREERDRETPVVEFELEAEPPDGLRPAQEPARFSAAVPAVPPAAGSEAETVLSRPDAPETLPPAFESDGVAWPAEGETSLAAEEPVSAADRMVEDLAAWAPLPGAADDLKLIEGIGPKIASVLHEAGIGTFAGLAASDVDRLRSILREADPRLLRLADPGTWPEQARLAAVGAWDELAELQKGLRGGRQSH